MDGRKLAYIRRALAGLRRHLADLRLDDELGAAGAAMAGETDIRIAVCDPASAYRRGLGSAFAAAGYIVEDVDDVRVQAVLPAVDVALLTIRSANDWQVLHELLAVNPKVKLIALLVDPTPDRHAEALRSGAHCAVGWEATPEAILAVVGAALQGLTLLPTAVAQAVAASGPALYDPEWITEEETGWLRLLAAGTTVQQLADKVGYSERALYRLLHGLYGRMRVSNRTEAILQASRWGLLDD
jgi:DNA-binding NarL/FixJ family response regulator